MRRVSWAGLAALCCGCSSAWLSSEPLFWLAGSAGGPALAAAGWGPRTGLLAAQAPCMIGWIVKIWSDSKMASSIAAALLGAGSAGSLIVLPSYLSDVHNHTSSKDSISVALLLNSVGVMFATVMAEAAATFMWTMLSLQVLFFVVFVWMPEGPTFLLDAGRDDEAAFTIWRLNAGTIRQSQKLFWEMKLQYIERKRAAHSTLNRSALPLCLLLVSLHSIGLTLITYSQGTFEGSTPSRTSAIVSAAFLLMGSCLSIVLVNKLGNKQFQKLLLGSIVSLSAFMIAMTAYHLITPKIHLIPMLVIPPSLMTLSSVTSPLSLIMFPDILSISPRASLTTSISLSWSIAALLVHFYRTSMFVGFAIIATGSAIALFCFVKRDQSAAKKREETNRDAVNSLL